MKLWHIECLQFQCILSWYEFFFCNMTSLFCYFALNNLFKFYKKPLRKFGAQIIYKMLNGLNLQSLQKCFQFEINCLWPMYQCIHCRTFAVMPWLKLYISRSMLYWPFKKRNPKILIYSPLNSTFPPLYLLFRPFHQGILSLKL